MNDELLLLHLKTIITTYKFIEGQIIYTDVLHNILLGLNLD